MENTSVQIPERELAYYRARQRNRIFERISQYYAERAEHDGVTKRDLARKLNKDPAQITRWLRSPSNLTLDTVSDLLLALGAEMDAEVASFADVTTPNDIHPWAQDYWVSGSSGLGKPDEHSTSTEHTKTQANNFRTQAAPIKTTFEVRA